MIKKLILLLIIIPSLLTMEVTKASGQGENFELDQQMIVEAKPADARALILRDYLAERNSPLQYHANDFIQAADKYQLDWKLVAAISGVESTFGKAIPGGHDPLYTSYNGWGWGVYGTQSLGFKSWRDGIFTVSRGLKEDYVSRGLLEPIAMNRRYASSPTWGVRVVYFMNDIDKFSKKYPAYKDLTLEANKGEIKGAADSAKLAVRFVSIGGI